jgi:hypothetical protein
MRRCGLDSSVSGSGPMVDSCGHNNVIKILGISLVVEQQLASQEE